MFGYCVGKAGANSVAMLTPSGFTRARYSPLALRLKLACSGAPGTTRFLPEAKTIRKPPGATFVAGKRHLVRLAAVSVRNHPLILVALVPELKISIQSEESPSSSRSPLLLLARNSLMVTVSTAQTRAAAIASTRNRRKTFFKLWDEGSRF